MTSRTLATLIVAGLAVTRPARGQQSSEIAGHVVDSTETPVRGASVVIANGAARTTSNREGAFRLRVPRGHWIIVARGLGFRPDSAVLDIPSTDSAVRRDVVLRLRPVPFALRGLTVAAAPATPMSVTATRENVRQLPALGEPDILRVLPFLPGVQQPNDMRGALFFAGGASDESAIAIDGFRVQWPTHVNGILGAINVAAVDRADVLIYREPPGVSGAIGGVVNIQTRSIPARTAGEASVTLLSATATAAVPSVAGAADVLASARATYAPLLVDRIVGHARAVASDLTPPSFRDGIMRLSHDWGNGARVTALGYATADEETPRLSNAGVPLSWGEGLASVRLEAPTPLGRAQVWTSRDGSYVRFTDSEDESRRVDVRQDWYTTGVQIERDGRYLYMQAGASADHRANVHRWNTTAAQAAFGSSVPFSYDASTTQTLAAGYFDLQATPIHGWSGSVGIRSPWLRGNVWAEPRLYIARTLTSRWTLGTALERRLQFDAQLGPVGDGSVAQPTFLIDRPRRADAAALQADWTDGGVHAVSRSIQIVAYARRYVDRPLAVPSSIQDTIVPGFPQFRRVPGGAYGAAVGVTMGTHRGAWFEGHYTYQDAWNRIDDARTPAEWDIRHALALFAASPTIAGYSATLSGQFHGGFPVTPVAARVLVPAGTSGDVFTTRFVYGVTNSARLPGFRRLDVSLRREWRSLGASWTASLDATNFLARNNPIAYDWRVYFDELVSSSMALTSHGGLPFVPSLGLSARW
ncbi:MAG TPA: TonB-dependent receptor [Gemmatimonadaceae bacterium]|nr:TonB-dependent receptor [Gemmatimonadaceae bacterium]